VQIVARLAQFGLQASLSFYGSIAPTDSDVWEGPHGRKVFLE